MLERRFYVNLQVFTELELCSYSEGMVKLVGVIGADEGKAPVESRVCLARRQFPLVIEPDLTMIMALDDSCLACGGSHSSSSSPTSSKHRDRDWDVFLRNYRRWERGIRSLV